jgi:endonuclease YncB( thermonuclease family)
MNNEQREILLKCKKDKQDTSFKGIKTYAKCVEVYDGDTCRLKFFYRNEITQCSVRLLGIDAPELEPKKIGRTPESIQKEKDAAKKARDELKSLIYTNNLVYVVFEDYDKYGRPLVTLYLNDKDEKSVNQIIIDKGYGINYDGGHKQNFDNINTK